MARIYPVQKSLMAEKKKNLLSESGKHRIFGHGVSGIIYRKKKASCLNTQKINKKTDWSLNIKLPLFATNIIPASTADMNN